MATRFANAVILDGYVDEPTALGVPPYISPYPRYAAGALLAHGLEPTYFTIDQWRKDQEIRETIASLGPDALLVVVSGLTVPGHYRGGTPLTLSELNIILDDCAAAKVVGGPIRHGYTLTGGTTALAAEGLSSATIVQGDLEAYVADLVSGIDEPKPRLRSFFEVAQWAPLGAAICPSHPNFPHIIAEIETARGCERTRHCSFCTEGLHEGLEFRSANDIVAEVEGLAHAGVAHFRLGKQPNLLAWPGRRGPAGTVIPDPGSFAELYRGIRAAAPGLRTLHIDNVNPGFLAAHPEQCGEILQIIAAHNTPGDVAAMGLESADPEVVRINCLKSTASQALRAIEITNQAGAHRPDGSLPALLPGINLIFGLPGETSDTYELNYRFLSEVAQRDLLLRRVNLRQVMVFPGTPLAALTGGRQPKLNKARFKRFKQRVAEEFERPMLRRIVPLGTILRGVVTEFRDGDVTFGRQLASYPILVGLPLRLPLMKAQDVVIVGHGFRSVTGLPYPIAVNELPEKALAALPGLGKKRARRIGSARPFSSAIELLACLDEPRVIEPFLSLMTFRLKCSRDPC